MTEYIKRTAVFEQFDNADADVCETDDFGGVDYGFGMKNVKELINAIPAADVAPVVRCKDCDGSQVSDDGKYIVCCRLGVRTGFWDFCSRGAKMEGGK